MPFLQDLRRLLFGAKAVTTSAAEKAGETIRDTARDTREELDAWMDRMRKEAGVEPPEPAQVTPPSPEPERPDLLHRTGEQLRETGGEILHKAGEVAEKTGKVILDKGKKVEEAIEGLGEQVISVGEKLTQKAGEVAEKVGSEVLEKGGDILDRAREFLKDTSHKTGEEFGKLYDKAQEEAARDQAEKAAKKAEQEAYAAKYRTETPQGKDHLDALDPSLLAGKDSFFEKADQFAKGNHHHGELHILPGEKTPRPKSDAPTAGFEDRDGDGDDIIDDAEIVTEEPPRE